MQSLLALGGLTLATLLSGCEPAGPQAQTAAPKAAPTFRILAGSELKDMQAQTQEFGRQNGINIQMDFTGSIDAVDRLSESHTYDAVWVSHGKYLQLVPGVKEQVKASEKTMYSRVVLGVDSTKLKSLGWAAGAVTWKQVLAATQSGKFHFAMTNPSGSNTGFVTLVGIASELSGKGDALEEADIPDGQLKKFFSGLSLTSGSSGDLAEKYKADPSKADGLVNYESVIRSLKQAGVPLEVVVPKEGVITADYPLMLLARSQQAPIYTKLVDYLRQEDTQTWIAQNTFRTPLKGSGSEAVTNELPFPGNLRVVDAILRGFLDSYSKPATSYFVLDVSGSMAGPRMSDMKKSVSALATGDGSVSGRFSTFRDREHVGVIPFASKTGTLQEVQLGTDLAANKQALQSLSNFVAKLEPQDGTGIYDALAKVYGPALDALSKGDRSVSIVLLTDGENNSGIELKTFLNMLPPKGQPRVPIYGVLYGEASAADMQALTDATGGRTFDARKQSLSQVLKVIRSYQ